MTRGDRYLLAFVLLLSALAAPIILRSNLSTGDKFWILTLGTAFMVVRGGPWMRPR